MFEFRAVSSCSLIYSINKMDTNGLFESKSRGALDYLSRYCVNRRHADPTLSNLPDIRAAPPRAGALAPAVPPVVAAAEAKFSKKIDNIALAVGDKKAFSVEFNANRGARYRDSQVFGGSVGRRVSALATARLDYEALSEFMEPDARLSDVARDKLNVRVRMLMGMHEELARLEHMSYRLQN